MRPPKNPFYPGEILLEEFLKPAGITQMAFARKISWTRARMNEFIKGKRGVGLGQGAENVRESLDEPADDVRTRSGDEAPQGGVSECTKILSSRWPGTQ